ncbi:MAG: VapC toxin family PIN domain ribonuclease, partial [Actinobacteria bacterium]|nr:VapC toxin family PIN domain ribonuclease [Actinomycetota bacterium]
YVDASIVAIAERLKINKIFTLDRKHFEVVAPRGFDNFDILI